MKIRPLRSLGIFTKYPYPGRVKTRLIPVLGEAESARIHRILTERTCRLASRFARKEPVDLSVCFTGGDEILMRNWLGTGFSYVEQSGDDLGARMEGAFHDRFARGFRSVVIIGTDCPDLSVLILKEAFDALGRADVVLGPAADGGYYLIGLRDGIPDLFHEIDWGTVIVLSQTKRKILRLGLRCIELEMLHDIDRPEDIARYPDLLTGMEVD